LSVHDRIADDLLPRQIFVAADHAGLPLKKYLIHEFASLPWKDLGTQTDESVDYPDFSDLVAEKINTNAQKNKEPQSTFHNSIMGLLICGSGQGMAIRANRFRHVRAALCWNTEIAKIARAHNDANILCLGARFVESKLAAQILTTFLTTPFEGGRHARRVAKLAQDI